MLEDPVDFNPLVHRAGETPRDQIFTGGRHLPAEQQLPATDLGVLLPGDVPAHHVVQQDPQGPDSGRTSLVFPSEDPFWEDQFNVFPL